MSTSMGTRLVSALVAIVALLAVYSSWPAQAQTEEPTDAPLPEPYDIRGDIDRSEQALIEAQDLAASLEISVDTALTLLERQEQFQRVRVHAEALYPDTFAGAWVTNQREGGRLGIAFTDAAEESALSAASTVDSLDVDVVDPVTVVNSLNELRAARDRGLDSLDALLRLGAFALSIDEPTNSLEIWSDASLSDDDRATVEEVLRSTALTFVVSRRPEDADIPSFGANCRNNSRTHCNPLRGGTRLHAPNNYNAYCTAGFNYYRDSDGLQLLSTAGHCNNTREHSDVQLGFVADSEFGYADVQFHTRNGFSTSRWVYNRPDQQNYAITGRYTGTAVNESTRLCTSGVTSGPFTNSNRCGDVVDNDWSGLNADGDTMINQFIFNQTCQGGDSGSPVYRNAVGYGQVWGQDPRCFASYLRRIEDTHGVTLRN